MFVLARWKPPLGWLRVFLTRLLLLPFETGSWNWSGFLLLSRWYQAGAPCAPRWSPGRNKLRVSLETGWNHLHGFRWDAEGRSGTFVLSGPRGCLKTIKRGAFASSRVTLFNLFTKRSGRGVMTGLGASLWQEHREKNVCVTFLSRRYVATEERTTS